MGFGSGTGPGAETGNSGTGRSGRMHVALHAVSVTVFFSQAQEAMGSARPSASPRAAPGPMSPRRNIRGMIVDAFLGRSLWAGSSGFCSVAQSFPADGYQGSLRWWTLARRWCGITSSKIGRMPCFTKIRCSSCRWSFGRTRTPEGSVPSIVQFGDDAADEVTGLLLELAVCGKRHRNGAQVVSRGVWEAGQLGLWR